MDFFYLKIFMAEIRWFRVAIAAAIGLAILAAVTYWQAQQNPLNDVDIDLAMKGCAVVYAPDGSYEVIPFGDPRCAN
jgi:ABC-type Fe3+-siderophore transport system permease subunit